MVKYKERLWLFLDFETTGLEPERDGDRILEVSAAVVNPNFEVIAGYTQMVHQPDEVLLRMNDWYKETHWKTDLVQEVCASTKSLLKCKMFKTEKFQVAGVRPGKGKMADAAVFRCATKLGSEFEVVMKGSMEYRRQLLADHSLWQGKQLTVQFQNYSAKMVPRFPVGIAIRDYE
jgi:hypothetical protein